MVARISSNGVYCTSLHSAATLQWQSHNPATGGRPDHRTSADPFTQHAVSGVIGKLRQEGFAAPEQILIEGISRGAVVASVVAAHDPSIAGIILISGLDDLNAFAADPKSSVAKSIARSVIDETGGGRDALRARSPLHFVGDVKASVLVLNGAQDDRTDPAQAQRFADEITSHGGKARVIIYPTYGHQIPVEVRGKEIDPFIDRVVRK